jgi:hypothetical protein
VFIDGFTAALWVRVAFSAVGIVAALLIPGRHRPNDAAAGTQPALAPSEEPA